MTYPGYEQILRETEREITFFDMLRFLYRYGYFTKIMEMSFHEIVTQLKTSMPEFREAVRRFQDFYQLTVDGDPGPQTQRAMMVPRCGCPDILPEASSDGPSAIKNYQGQGRWPIEKMSDGVKYYVQSSVPTSDVGAIIEAANRWNRVCGINLQRTQNANEANITVTQKRIDGAGGTLALGWFPMQNSASQNVEQRLDSGERWPFAFRAEVSCHEFGHNLGWNHKNGTSVMHPYATGQWPEPTAHDVNVAQDYYGKPVVVDEPDEPDVPTTPTEPPASNPFSRVKIFLPNPETDVLTECYVAPVTVFEGL